MPEFLTNPDFLINLAAGLCIFILEIFLVVLLLPLVLKWHENKKWAYARRATEHLLRQESEELQIAIYHIAAAKGKSADAINLAGTRALERFESEGKLSAVSYMTAAMTPKLSSDLADFVVAKTNVRNALYNLGPGVLAPFFYGEASKVQMLDGSKLDDVARFARNFNLIRNFSSDEAARKSRELVVMPMVKTMEDAGYNVDLSDVR